MSSEHIQRTLILFKPDAVQRGVVGEILTRFERVGLKIIGTKMIAPDEEHYYKHYEEIGQLLTRRGKETMDNQLKTMAVIYGILANLEEAMCFHTPSAYPAGPYRDPNEALYPHNASAHVLRKLADKPPLARSYKILVIGLATFGVIVAFVAE